MSNALILPRSTDALAEVVDGKLRLRFHDGQMAAWKSQKRFILVLSGARSGKTSFEPWWLHREMKAKGPGDYLLCAPTFKLLDKAAVPYLTNAFSTILKLGKTIGGSQGHFEVSPQGEWLLWGSKQKKPTRINFGHADNPDSLEAAQYKAAVCDEAGQKLFRQESWEAIQRRLAIDQGRALICTTPYTLNWLKTEVHDRAVRYRNAARAGLPARKEDADYDLINFESIMNPAFPLEEFERAKATLPPWKFDLFYRGIFSRPAGAIYDCFRDDYHVVPSGYVPPVEWPVLCGIDFGAPNFAAVFLSEEPGTKKLTAFAEYRPQESKRVFEHVLAMHGVLRGVFKAEAMNWASSYNKSLNEWTRLPDVCVGGAMSEGQWRDEFLSMGWPILEPDQREVEIGITRCWSAFQERKLAISEDCPFLLDDIRNYSRPVDEDGLPMEGIEDKDEYHSVDALRYIVGWTRRVGYDLDVWR